MRFLNASVLPRKSLNRNLSWGPPLGNLLLKTLDERQITHLIRARLKYDPYDFLRGVLGLLPVLFLV